MSQLCESNWRLFESTQVRDAESGVGFVLNCAVTYSLLLVLRVEFLGGG